MHTTAFFFSAISLFTAVIAAPTNLIERQFGSSSTRNDLVNGLCRPVTVIFARGTGESGNVGSSTGPPWFTALSSALGSQNVAFQGVDYAATTAGFVNDAAGNAKVASLIAQAASQCPTTQIVLGGYSQGAMIMHRGTSSIPTSSSSRIAAAVMFGDPFNGQPFRTIPADKVKTFCHTGDNVCRGTASITAQHLNYRNDASAAAAFVKSKVTL